MYTAQGFKGNMFLHNKKKCIPYPHIIKRQSIAPRVIAAEIWHKNTKCLSLKTPMGGGVEPAFDMQPLNSDPHKSHVALRNITCKATGKPPEQDDLIKKAFRVKGAKIVNGWVPLATEPLDGQSFSVFMWLVTAKMTKQKWKVAGVSQQIALPPENKTHCVIVRE